MDIDPEDILVIATISARQVAATVVVLQSPAGQSPAGKTAGDEPSEQVVAHKSVPCTWHSATGDERGQALAEAVRLAAESAGIEPYSIYLSCADASLSSRIAVGYAAPGEEIAFSVHERDWALRRAREQATGADREVLDVLPVQWTVRGPGGERDVPDPVGERGTHLTCQALLVTVKRGLRAEMAALAHGVGLELDHVIPQPLALYRGAAGRLKIKGTTLVIDCGARHTTVLVRRKDRLVHAETFAFGGDILTATMADQLGIPVADAEKLKLQLDLACVPDPSAPQGQQMIWSDLREGDALLAPATRICADTLTNFFAARARDLREHSHLGQAGQVHLVGRGAGMGGLVGFLRDIFALPVVLGTGDKGRQPGDELDGLLTTGLVCLAADHRREQKTLQSRTLRKRASGMWSWLNQTLA
jgi:cell division protein FtsA